MKQITTFTGWLVMAAALTIGMSACSGNDDTIAENPTPQQPTTGKYILTVRASKGDDATRALSLDGTTLNAYWDGNEVVTVKEGNATLGTLTATPDATDNTQATLSGTLKDLPTGNELKLELNSATYGSQDGTIEYIESNCDYATATITVTVDGNTVTGSDAIFTNQNAIAKFTLKDGNNVLNPSNVVVTASHPTMGDLHTFNFTIPDATYTTNNGNVLYFALPTLTSMGISEQAAALLAPFVSLNFTATVGDNTYIYTKSGYPFAAGSYYAITVNMYERDINLTGLTENITMKNGQVLSGTLSGHYVNIADGATVTLAGVDITTPKECGHAAIHCLGSANIILQNSTDNKVLVLGDDNNGNAYPAVYVPSGSTLTISGTGKLTADSSSDGCYGAGIGGGNSISCGNIHIKGGTIIATGGKYAAGIGAGSNESCGYINIDGGSINATGGKNAAGIGSGSWSSCGIITINGGTINATGGEDAAGIGCGAYGSCSNINISDGDVTAKGNRYGAGIGYGGDGISCGDINITGGKVTATKGSKADYSIDARGEGDSNSGNITIDSSADVTQN